MIGLDLALDGRVIEALLTPPQQWDPRALEDDKTLHEQILRDAGNAARRRSVEPMGCIEHPRRMSGVHRSANKSGLPVTGQNWPYSATAIASLEVAHVTSSDVNRRFVNG